MSRPTTSAEKTFTLAGANATLPLVRAITQDLAGLAKAVQERRARVEALIDSRKSRESDVYSDELSHVLEEIAKDEQRVEAYAEELRELGVEIQDRQLGLIDFPSILNGRRVYLSWQLGEPEVLSWHESGDEAFARRPLPPRRAASSFAVGGEFFEG